MVTGIDWMEVMFREDAARDHAPENLNILRKIALALLRGAPDLRLSGKKRKMTGSKRRFTAAMNQAICLPSFLEVNAEALGSGSVPEGSVLVPGNLDTPPVAPGV
jgi:hypothetical protein